jgi:hypothetical protein
MQMRPTRNAMRNALSGFLLAYGVIAFICFSYLQQRWYAAAPHLPDVGEGLIVPHNEHGFIRYFSAFQGTSCTLLLATSIPLCIIGHLVGPKKNAVFIRRRLSISAVWDRDDPGGLWPIGMTIGVLAAPAIIFLIGPSFVRWLNAAGIITGV